MGLEVLKKLKYIIEIIVILVNLDLIVDYINLILSGGMMKIKEKKLRMIIVLYS
jgi:hypothetical protein